MGRKKKKPSKPWCWYCNRDFDDEKILLQHQKAKHFKCHICHKKLYTGPGLSIHCMQVHKETLDRVPNSLPTRGNIEIEIYGMEGIPEADIRDHEAQKQSGRIMTAEGADSSDEEGGSAAKKMKTAQPMVPDSATANIPMGAMPMPSMLTSPFMGLNPMTHYLGHLPLPIMGGMSQMPLGGAASASPQSTSKPLFPSSGSSPSSSSSSTSKPAFAAYSSTGAGATIVGESTVPKKSGIIATQAGSTKIMHPEEDLSLEELRARRPRYQKNAIATNLSQAQAPVASQIPPVNPANAGHVGLPMGHLPAGMMIPAYLQPHMQLGMGGLLRGPHMPHMPGLPGGFNPYPPLGFPLQMPPRFR
uniref:EOG090X0A5X n=1 Tax=Eubosmina coregoni TaxID=186181 RepID=A0A4Y7LRG7_9CRUS|nr:EOG090X0A5X [Eubosmina coregoni]SVE69949.1 EOG090X0A5X [Eubosmina coregoni]